MVFKINSSSLDDYANSLTNARNVLKNINDVVPDIQSQLINKYPKLYIHTKLNNNSAIATGSMKVLNKILINKVRQIPMPQLPQYGDKQKEEKKGGNQLKLVLADVIEITLKKVLMGGHGH